MEFFNENSWSAINTENDSTQQRNENNWFLENSWSANTEVKEEDASTTGDDQDVNTASQSSGSKKDWFTENSWSREKSKKRESDWFRQNKWPATNTSEETSEDEETNEPEDTLEPEKTPAENENRPAHCSWPVGTEVEVNNNTKYHRSKRSKDSQRICVIS